MPLPEGWVSVLANSAQVERLLEMGPETFVAQIQDRPGADLVVANLLFDFQCNYREGEEPARSLRQLAEERWPDRLWPTIAGFVGLARICAPVWPEDQVRELVGAGMELTFGERRRAR